MWEEVVSVKEPVALSLHRSKRSGLSVVVAKIPGPTSQLHVTFKSESFDDRGMPHSLEHLVFLGSESLPFKGVLDDCSQRVSASTNAWTAQESTTFTLDAGSECKVVEALLPLYLDSLFFPQLKEEHFLTEVHSINGENEDQGVVFCEMQGREQEQGDVTAYALNKLMFPGVNTINCNSGGSLAALRKPDNNMEVVFSFFFFFFFFSHTIKGDSQVSCRLCDLFIFLTSFSRYHSEAYRPENCIIFVSGCNFEFAELCAALDEIDARLAARSKSLPSVPKPFSSPLEPMVAKTETVYFPSDSDSFCTLEVYFLFLFLLFSYCVPQARMARSWANLR
jgi:Zn-dependent M16 (insulinase) family peptidase